jgi:WASH complex subunit 7
MIIPALTLNFVEHMLKSKEAMTRKGKEKEGIFTDDGFALGVAYILKILRQNKHFKQLHWFEAIEFKYEHDRTQAEECTLRSHLGVFILH